MAGDLQPEAASLGAWGGAGRGATSRVRSRGKVDGRGTGPRLQSGSARPPPEPPTAAILFSHRQIFTTEEYTLRLPFSCLKSGTISVINCSLSSRT